METPTWYNDRDGPWGRQKELNKRAAMGEFYVPTDRAAQEGMMEALRAVSGVQTEPEKGPKSK